MSTVRHYLQCEVCGTVTLLRTQLGWLFEHPIRIHCGTCNILIGGKAHLNPLEGTHHFEFTNAKEVAETTPQFYVEASGELLTLKPRAHTSTGIPVYSPAFFHAGLWAMGNDGFEQFKRHAVGFLSVLRDWPRVRRIHELWRDGKSEYLAQEVHQYLPRPQFPMTNMLEKLRGVHQMSTIFFSEILDPRRFRESQRWLSDEIAQLSRANGRGLFDLALHFGDNKLLDRYETKILDRFEQFVERFQYMLPVFGLQFYQEIPQDLADQKGISTASFEDLKSFYLDCYETVADIAKLIVAFNNLKYRANFEAMAPRRRDIQTLPEWDAKAKGIKLGFLDGTESFDRFVNPQLQSQLRNAIGHNSYRYNGFTQTLVYYPSGSEDPQDVHSMTFLEFVRLCWGMFLTAVDLSELVYETRKLYFFAHGHQPMVKPSAFLSRRARREEERAWKKAQQKHGRGQTKHD